MGGELTRVGVAGLTRAGVAGLTRGEKLKLGERIRGEKIGDEG